MHLHRLRITNFRALENIEAEFDSLVSVIIGPNAIGKTSILEAIRLAKATLASRTQNEGNSTLNRLGITSPHMPQQVFAGALTNKTDQPTVIRCSFKAEPSEIAAIEQLIPQLAPNLALQNIGLGFGSPAQVMGFLSSPQGQGAVEQARSLLAQEFSRFRESAHLEINLIVDFRGGSISGEHPIQQLFYASLEQRLEPAQSMFSYFPADRAMPIGDHQPVMIGMQDSLAQLESYNSQPETKYNRLKQTIFNSIIGKTGGRAELSRQFSLIFERILKGRELGNVGLNQFGQLAIQIVDTETKSTFDIDGLSSGEKGIILTFLNIAKSISRNGLILLDEPELHLNPAVCRDLLQFLVDEYAEKNNIQAVICSHSAEVLASAFERSSCSLFHLRNGNSLAKVRQQDQGEIRDALRRLGSSESEALLYKGTVSVEGLHDVEILRSGFDHIFRRHKLKQLGGRGQIEADINELQEAEKRGDEIGYHFFIFDHDRKPTSLVDSTHVRLRQLQRYCLENYLLDTTIITDLTRESDFSDIPINNVTDATNAIKRLALAQLNQVVAREVFKDLGLDKVAFDMRVLRTNDVSDMASGLWTQIEGIQSAFERLSKAPFPTEFARLFELKLSQLRPLWEDKWREVCDGKQLLEDMRRNGIIRGDLLRLKKRIALEMRNRATETWNSLDSLLKSLVTV